MKKVSLLVLLAALGLMVTSVAMAASITVDPNINWVSAPLIPFNPSPENVFVDMGGIPLNLLRFDAATQSEIPYIFPDDPGYGGMLLGDGHQLIGDGVGQVICDYDGVPDSYLSDVWISLSGNVLDTYTEVPNGGGIHWIGQPFDHLTDFEAIQVTDGTQTVSIRTAVETNGWLNGLWTRYDGTVGVDSEVVVGFIDQGAQEWYLSPGYCYKLVTKKDNLALIIPTTEYVP